MALGCLSLCYHSSRCSPPRRSYPSPLPQLPLHARSNSRYRPPNCYALLAKVEKPLQPAEGECEAVVAAASSGRRVWDQAARPSFRLPVAVSTMAVFRWRADELVVTKGMTLHGEVQGLSSLACSDVWTRLLPPQVHPPDQHSRHSCAD